MRTRSAGLEHKHGADESSKDNGDSTSHLNQNTITRLLRSRKRGYHSLQTSKNRDCSPKNGSKTRRPTTIRTESREAREQSDERNQTATSPVSTATVDDPRRVQDRGKAGSVTRPLTETITEGRQGIPPQNRIEADHTLKEKNTNGEALNKVTKGDLRTLRK